MGYFFLLIALLAGVTKGYCGKRTSGYTNGLRDAVFANFIRMLFCMVIGFVLILATEGLGSLIPDRRVLWISALSGCSTAVFVASWLMCIRKSAYMMVDVFLMLGTLIPLLASSAFFGEAIKWTQWVGMAVLFAAVLMMCSYNNSIKSKITPVSFVLLLVCGTANGVADFSQKLFIKTVPAGSAAVFNFYTYIFAALFLLGTLLVVKKEQTETDGTAVKKIIGFIMVMALCLFANSFFKTLAASYLDAVLLYPLNQGCALILASLMASVFFKEKLTLKAVIGLITAFIGLVIINLI